MNRLKINSRAIRRIRHFGHARGGPSVGGSGTLLRHWKQAKYNKYPCDVHMYLDVFTGATYTFVWARGRVLDDPGARFVPLRIYSPTWTPGEWRDGVSGLGYYDATGKRWEGLRPAKRGRLNELLAKLNGTIGSRADYNAMYFEGGSRHHEIEKLVIPR